MSKTIVHDVLILFGVAVLTIAMLYFMDWLL